MTRETDFEICVSYVILVLEITDKLGVYMGQRFRNLIDFFSNLSSKNNSEIYKRYLSTTTQYTNNNDALLAIDARLKKSLNSLGITEADLVQQIGAGQCDERLENAYTLYLQKSRIGKLSGKKA